MEEGRCFVIVMIIRGSSGAQQRACGVAKRCSSVLAEFHQRGGGGCAQCVVNGPGSSPVFNFAKVASGNSSPIGAQPAAPSLLPAAMMFRSWQFSSAGFDTISRHHAPREACAPGDGAEGNFCKFLVGPDGLTVRRFGPGAPAASIVAACRDMVRPAPPTPRLLLSARPAVFIPHAPESHAAAAAAARRCCGPLHRRARANVAAGAALLAACTRVLVNGTSYNPHSTQTDVHPPPPPGARVGSDAAGRGHDQRSKWPARVGSAVRVQPQAPRPGRAPVARGAAWRIPPPGLRAADNRGAGADHGSAVHARRGERGRGGCRWDRNRGPRSRRWHALALLITPPASVYASMAAHRARFSACEFHAFLRFGTV